MNKLRDVTKRLSLKAVSRYSKLEAKESLSKAGKSVNSIIGLSQKGGADNPFGEVSQASGVGPR